MPANLEVPIKVAVRIRPFVGQERLRNPGQCIAFIPGKSQLILGKDKGFTFDYVFPPETEQGDVYETCVQQLVRGCFEGYNATVFAYGQTGSGKTHTMGTGNCAGLLQEEFGILPRALEDIFQTIKENKEKIFYKARVSFIEIYMEEAKDLLDFEDKGKDMHIREDEKGNTAISGLKEETVLTFEDVMNCLDIGTASRHTESTNMNEYSSRSHCIFTLTIDQHQIFQEHGNRNECADLLSDTSSVISAKFHFVDLAGSERAHRTGNQGERFRESISINSGLLALGNVISSLSETKRRILHVPYRQSKLTRLLKDSLGGNSRTLMITCLSPSNADFDENFNSLKYATRARNIKNKPVVNRDLESAKLGQMQREIQVLRDELQRHRSGSDSDSKALVNGTQVNNESLRTLEAEIERYKSQCSFYQDIVQEAAALIATIHKADMPPYNIHEQLGSWLTAWESFSKFRPVSAPVTSGPRRPQSEVLHQLRDQLSKYKQDLDNDEEIFAEKIKELNDAKLQILTLEEENSRLRDEIEEIKVDYSQTNEKLFQQQLKIETLEGKGSYNKKSTYKRSAPSFPAPKTAPANSVPDEEISERDAVRTSPAALSEEKIIQSFRARSNLLLSQHEDQDEVAHDYICSSEEEEEKMQNESTDKRGKQTIIRSLSGTYTKDLKQHLLSDKMTTSPRKQQEMHYRLQTNTSRTPMKDTTNSDGPGTPSRLPVRKVSDAETDAIKRLRKGTEATKKELRNAEFQLRDAQQKLRNFESNIKQKEELIKELAKSEKEAQILNKQYDDKLNVLSKEVDKSRKELDEAKHKLDNFEKQGQSNNEKHKLEKEYKKKLSLLETKLQTLQKKQNDTKTVNTFKDNSERKISSLEGYVERLKNQHDDFQRRLKDESNKKIKLEQDMKKGEQKIMELELKTEQQRKLLKRKTEEAVVAQRKLRSGNLQGENEEKNALEERKRWLDGELEKLVERKQTVEELDEELKRREEIIKKREDLLAEKSNLEMKRLRASHILTKDVMRVSVQLDDVERALEAKKHQSSITNPDKIQNEIENLLITKAELDKQRIDIEQRLLDDDVLEPMEQRRLLELSEAIDALEISIQYRNNIINDKGHDLEDNEMKFEKDIQQVFVRLGELNQNETIVLLQKYFERVIELKETERRTVTARDELEVEVEERDKRIYELEHSVSQIELRTERTLTAQQSEYERKLQFLMEQINDTERETQNSDVIGSLERKIQHLEKDLYYYKKTSRELKHRLRDLSGTSLSIADSHVSDKPPESSRIFHSSDATKESNNNKGFTFSNPPRVLTGDELHLPTVQRVVREKKKVKCIDSPSSQRKPDRGRSFEKQHDHEEQKRLKEIFESKVPKAKIKERKPSGDHQTEKRSTGRRPASPTQDSIEASKNPWS